MKTREVPKNLCTPDRWRIEPVYGLMPGYLVTLRCKNGHLHHAQRFADYRRARACIRRWHVSIFGPEPPDRPRDIPRDLPIEDLAQPNARPAD